MLYKGISHIFLYTLIAANFKISHFKIKRMGNYVAMCCNASTRLEDFAVCKINWGLQFYSLQRGHAIEDLEYADWGEWWVVN
jgi:hypothetical protein